ncbi:hypothetical protein FQA39_LY02498 [Lamprigera yunnana]|nr:hypothetical protein FQA39_LY02498 [Lamprigera yunnana]
MSKYINKKQNKHASEVQHNIKIHMMELVFACIMLGGFGLPTISGNPDAKRLYDDLLSNYNRLIRPVGNNSDRLTVKMGLRLSQLIDVVSN